VPGYDGSRTCAEEAKSGGLGGRPEGLANVKKPGGTGKTGTVSVDRTPFMRVARKKKPCGREKIVGASGVGIQESWDKEL